MRLRKSTGLVLDLRMREGSGASVTDYSRYGNHGAVNGGCAWGERGMVFDGSTGYVDCGNDATLDSVDAITIGTWFKRSSIDSTHTIVMKRAATGNISYYLRILLDNKVQFGCYDGNYHKTTTTETTTSTTDFYYLTGVFTGTYYKCYLNGVMVSETVDNTKLPITIGKLVVGKKGETDADYFNGSIDHPRIWNRALSAREIMRQYETEKHMYL